MEHQTFDAPWERFGCSADYLTARDTLAHGNISLLSALHLCLTVILRELICQTMLQEHPDLRTDGVEGKAKYLPECFRQFFSNCQTQEGKIAGVLQIGMANIELSRKIVYLIDEAVNTFCENRHMG